MATPTGLLPASDFPVTLLNILDVLQRENGLQSWQVFSEKFGVSVKLRFGQAQHGGQTSRTEVSKVAYSKKSPCQLRRDDRKATERRITRSRTQNVTEEDNDIEKPRGASIDTMKSPIPIQACSPVLPEACVSATTPGQSSPLSESFMSDQSSKQAPVKKSMDLDLDQQFEDNQHETIKSAVQSSTPQVNVGLTRAADADIKTPSTDSDKSDSDSEEDEFGANLSMSYEKYYKYRGPRPTGRSCSYCGIIKGKHGKVIMQCDFPGCGRKMCQLCVVNKHSRHKKYLSECTTGYIE